MIIHSSLKVDITYYYMQWFINRLKSGFFDIPSEKQGKILRYDFRINPIEKIYLHTKNPINIIKHYNDLKFFNYNYEIITHLAMYDKFYEPKICSKQKIFDQIRECKNLIGKENNSLCYGPIFKTFNNDINWHVSQFRFLCMILNTSVSTVYYDFSIKNSICKNSNTYGATEFTKEEQEEIIKAFQEIANSYNLELKPIMAIETLTHNEIDIGEINTCLAACKYCKYITNTKTPIIKNKKHSPASSLLIGNVSIDDKIIEVNLSENNKNKDKSSSLFDFM